MDNHNAVAFCVTGPHLQYTAIAITSLLHQYQHETPLKILVVCDDVLQVDIDYIRSLPTKLNRPNVTIDFWRSPIWVRDLKPYPMNGRVSSAPALSFWRMFLPAYFSTYHKILYLDNDVIVNTDVTTLFDGLDDNHTIAAVGDFLFLGSKKYEPNSENTVNTLKAYGLKNMRHYFNGGVIVMNVTKYNELYTTEQILTLIKSTSWNLADQTLMNIMFQGTTQLLPFRYNFQHSLQYFKDSYDWDPDLIKPIIAEYPHIAIRHFAGEGLDSAPYEHVSIQDKWDATFWRLMHEVKQRSMNDNNV
ncbi:glycosyltransferase family 8 protein [Lacticaseibacillus paracasei]|uniref:glycosyltransferase family 8 protein n=1 Tax=Lacticaseibacillus paracasei TaxID=1597 RepID=UPI000343A6AC|nr:glycosyltransferase [Lacticaseibacillus paracasei]EPC16411.1 glycosyl transferase [Lacticaseibacillus paracasei subsp. paracasei Lpp230]MCT3361917.1 glycosyl transferase [Lacticaseibacillus paracasei]UNG77888.1 glycosyl transferase [Lacticaseibacillus paracasei]